MCVFKLVELCWIKFYYLEIAIHGIHMLISRNSFATGKLPYSEKFYNLEFYEALNIQIFKIFRRLRFYLFANKKIYSSFD